MLRRPVLVFWGLFLVVVLGVAGTVRAAETGTEEQPGQEMELTLEQAVGMALKHDSRLAGSEIKLQMARIEQDDAWESYQQAEAALLTENGYFLYDPDSPDTQRAESAYSTYLTRQAAVETSEKEKQVVTDQVVYDVYRTYFDVLKAQQAGEAAWASAVQAEEELRVARIKVGMGLITRVDLTRAEQAYADAQAAVEAAAASLEQAYRALNDLVGLPATARPLLTEEVAFIPVKPMADLGAYVQSVLARDPVLWQLQRNADLQEILQRQYGTDGEERTELEEQQSELELADHRRAIEQKVISTYADLQQAERQYQIALAALDVAKAELQTKEFLSARGLVTRAEVLTATVDLARARQNLLSLTLEHELARMVLEKPWI